VLPVFHFRRGTIPIDYDPGVTELHGIYAILDGGLCADLDALLRDVLAGGVRLVQYRCKTGVDGAQVARLHEVALMAGATLVVNDDAAGALLAGGLHLGQEDLALHDMRALRARLGPHLLGISCATAHEAAAAERIGADYIGVGPYKATATKGDAGAPIGAAGIMEVARATRLPVAAIGGIGLDDLADVYAAGARMAAVASAIARAPSPRTAARAMVDCWRSLRDA
jgi:thiamine-phosphate pyrophosphorylase